MRNCESGQPASHHQFQEVTIVSVENDLKYPNLRYGNPNDLRFYMQGRTVRDIAKRLRRSERTVRNYLDYSEKMPWWVPEILRLSAMEAEYRAYQMNMRPVMVRMGIPQPDAAVYEFSPDRLQRKAPDRAMRVRGLV